MNKYSVLKIRINWQIEWYNETCFVGVIGGTCISVENPPVCEKP